MYHRSLKPLATTTLSRLPQLKRLTLTIANTVDREPKSGPLQLATEVLKDMAAGKPHALKYLNVVWPQEILTSLAFNVQDTSLEPMLKAFEQSITSLPFCEVVFSTACCRTNRRILATSALDRAFPALKDRRMLTIADRVPSRSTSLNRSLIRLLKRKT